MSGNLIKNIILAILLVWISFIIGSEAASDLQTAGVIISCIILLFVFIILGHNCWWLLFILPPILGLLPLGIIQKLPMQYSIAFMIFIYWIFMRLIGRSRFTWRSLPWLDCSLLVVVIYIAFTYYKSPVALNIFADENTKYIGGKGYIQIFSAVFYYIIICSIPYDWIQLKKVIRWMVWLTVLAALISAGIIFSGKGDFYGETGMSMGDAAVSTRFSAFLPIGTTFYTVIISLYPLNRIIFSPVKLILLSASVIAVMLSGFRNNIASMAAVALWNSIVYKKALFFIILSLGAYCSLLYLSSEKLLEELPFGVQRILSPLPGIKVSREAKQDADGSVEWRKTMWMWALDPRTGYIRDYTFGDGMGLDKQQMQRWNTTLSRGRIGNGELEMYADTRLWHSFYIETINAIGIVGLILTIFFMLEVLLLIMKLEIGLRHNSAIFYVVFVFSSFVQAVVHHFISTGTPGGVLMTTIGTGALAKVLYIEAKKYGLISSWSKRSKYVPLMVRDLNQSMT